MSNHIAGVRIDTQQWIAARPGHGGMMATNVTQKDKTLNEIIDISPTPYDCKPIEDTK